jgi:hypothetical protein
VLRPGSVAPGECCARGMLRPGNVAPGECCARGMLRPDDCFFRRFAFLAPRIAAIHLLSARTFAAQARTDHAAAPFVAVWGRRKLIAARHLTPIRERVRTTRRLRLVALCRPACISLRPAPAPAAPDGPPFTRRCEALPGVNRRCVRTTDDNRQTMEASRANAPLVFRPLSSVVRGPNAANPDHVPADNRNGGSTMMISKDRIDG